MKEKTIKEYVIVSQGCEIYRTKNKKRAEFMAKKNNGKWWDYVSWCWENEEPSCDYSYTVYEETTHHLKIEYNFACDVFAVVKRFEVRKNDRDFKVDDLIQFVCVRDGVYCKHPISCRKYRITYILKGGQYGINEDYVVLGIEQIKTY